MLYCFIETHFLINENPYGTSLVNVLEKTEKMSKFEK